MRSWEPVTTCNIFEQFNLFILSHFCCRSHLAWHGSFFFVGFGFGVGVGAGVLRNCQCFCVCPRSKRTDNRCQSEANGFRHRMAGRSIAPANLVHLLTKSLPQQDIPSAPTHTHTHSPHRIQLSSRVLSNYCCRFSNSCSSSDLANKRELNKKIKKDQKELKKLSGIKVVDGRMKLISTGIPSLKSPNQMAKIYIFKPETNNVEQLSQVL